jgi:hypothetical protein
MLKADSAMNGVRYSAFGLCLESNCPLQGLAPGERDGVPDLFIDVQGGERFQPAPSETTYYVSDWLDHGSGEPGLVIYRSIEDGSYIFRYAEGVEFQIAADSARIGARFASHSSLVDMTSFLTGPVLGFVLRMRGVIALHACAIDVGGRAIMLVGDAFAGKSTTAVMFARMGCAILTEDVAPLCVERGAIAVQSGCTEVALRPQAVEYLFGSADALPRFSDNWEKRRLDLAQTGAFSHRSLPIAAIYVLTNHDSVPDAPCVRPMSSGEAMVELLANIYANRLFHHELRLRELDMVHRVARTIPVKEGVTGGWSRPVERFCEVVLGDVRAS